MKKLIAIITCFLLCACNNETIVKDNNGTTVNVGADYTIVSVERKEVDDNCIVTIVYKKEVNDE